jgi:NAD(P)-dependent dehydrogenase (short-subunit alcohol dehydrogenase family)
MIHKGAGAIVNMSSGADVTGIPQNPIHDTSKHAVLGLTKSAALGYAKSAPGLVKTDIIALGI